MKHLTYLMIIALICLSACGENNQTAENETTEDSTPFCEENSFESLEAQAKAIQEAYEGIMSGVGDGENTYDKILFCAFPTNYEEVQNLFAYREEGPMIPEEIGFEILEYFAEMESIPSEVYYSRFIDLTVNGESGAEDPAYSFTVSRILTKDPKGATKALSQKSLEEIKSVFAYLYDEPEIGNLDMAFEDLQAILQEQSPKIAEIHKSTYNELVEKWNKVFEGDDE